MGLLSTRHSFTCWGNALIFLASSACDPAAAIARSIGFGSDMMKLKHSFSKKVKRRFLTQPGDASHHQSMLDNSELARRIRFAIEKAGRGTAARIVREIERAKESFTAQAITGWKRTGKIDRAHIPVLAKETGRRIDYFLDASVSDDESLDASQFARLRRETLVNIINAAEESSDGLTEKGLLKAFDLLVGPDAEIHDVPDQDKSRKPDAKEDAADEGRDQGTSANPRRARGPGKKG
jgi:hypothetical protein